VADREIMARSKIAASSQLTVVLECIRHCYVNNAPKPSSLTRDVIKCLVCRLTYKAALHFSGCSVTRPFARQAAHIGHVVLILWTYLHRKSLQLNRMSAIRNALISFGVFWLSLWVAWVLQFTHSDKLINAVVRDETILSAFVMGVLMSLGRTVAAALAGILVTVIIASPKSDVWAILVAVLYVIDAPVRHHWGYPATGWDRLWQGVDLALPAIACIAAALIAAHLWRKRPQTPV
jgi:hypothetical protein